MLRGHARSGSCVTYAPMEFERRVSGQFVTKVFAGVVGTPLAQSLLREGLDVTGTSPDVSVERFSQWLGLYSSHLYPEVAAAEAMRRVGFDMVRNSGKYDGQSLSQTMSMLPERLQRIGTFVDLSVSAHGPYRYVAHFDDVASLHTFFLGVLQGATSSAEVVWSPEGLSGARYEVRANLSTSSGLAAFSAQPTVVQ